MCPGDEELGAAPGSWDEEMGGEKEHPQEGPQVGGSIFPFTRVF